jgi:prepilin-type N-terminal cleavage/methylation domain-containing protein
MSITTENKYNRKGFTLMEILATIVLVALIIPVAMKGISIATNLAAESSRKLTAMNLAQNRLAEILLDEEWLNGSQSGDFTDENSLYRWQMGASDWTQPGLKLVEVRVYWDRRGYERNVYLATLVNDEN